MSLEHARKLAKIAEDMYFDDNDIRDEHGQIDINASNSLAESSERSAAHLAQIAAAYAQIGHAENTQPGAANAAKLEIPEPTITGHIGKGKTSMSDHTNSALYWRVYAESDPCRFDQCGGEHHTERGHWLQGMSSAVRAVMDLHVPTEDGRHCEECGVDTSENQIPWPCDTVKRIADTLL